MPCVLTVEQTRAVDRAAVEELGIPNLLLMENAGRGVAELVLAETARRPGVRVRIVCGAGSNGGDGFVAARHLALRGADVRVFLAIARGKVSGDAKTMLAALEAAAICTIDDGSAWSSAEWTSRLAGAEVVVDAVFGTGLRDEVRGVAAVAIQAMNTAPGLKVAVDIPSGIEADTGRVRAGSFMADVTASMGARKLGISLDAGVPAGRVEVIDLGVPIRPPPETAPFCYWLESEAVLAGLPGRRPTSHKGEAGHVLVIAGSAGRTGAALLAGQAALRAGAGLTTIATTGPAQIALDAKVVELMTVRYAAGEDAEPESARIVSELANRMAAAAVGPGIPTGPGMRELVAELVAKLPLPLVVDADALNLLGPELPRVTEGAPAPRILTPHPGEMARLLETTSAEIQRTRLASARRLAGDAGAIVVLKGARTLIVAPDGTAFVNPAAEPALATAGSGDVLTGLISALLAQGLEAIEAAKVGVHVHGLAGHLAAERRGGAGVIAGDLPVAIAEVMAAATRRSAG